MTLSSHSSVLFDFMLAKEEFNLLGFYPQSLWIIALGSYVECKYALCGCMISARIFASLLAYHGRNLC